MGHISWRLFSEPLAIHALGPKTNPLILGAKMCRNTLTVHYFNAVPHQACVQLIQ